MQEIRDGIGILETQKTVFQNAADSRQQQITSLRTAVSPPLNNSGTVLPRTLTTADSMRAVVTCTPLACDATNVDLKTAIRKPFVSL